MMEKMTFDGNFCDIAQCSEVPGGSFCEDGACSQKKVWERLKAYEDTGVTPADIKSALTATAVMNIAAQALGMKTNRLRELAEADKDGRVLILPCAPDAIYWERLGSILAQSRFEGLHVYEDGTIKYAGYGMEICAEDIGKTVFLSCEEAEKALQEMEG